MPVQMTHGVSDLSGMRERAFWAELELQAKRERRSATWQRKRAAMCRAGSNGLRKALAKASELEAHAALLMQTVNS